MRLLELCEDSRHHTKKDVEQPDDRYADEQSHGLDLAAEQVVQGFPDECNDRYSHEQQRKDH